MSAGHGRVRGSREQPHDRAETEQEHQRALEADPGVPWRWLWSGESC
jgi:hypothetical protein